MGGFAIDRMPLGRRGLLKGVGLASGLTAASFAGGGRIEAQRAGPFGEGGPIEAGVGIARAETASGLVEGYRLDGIFAFKGIPYAQDTSGANRFLPPRKPESWAGVRSSRSFGFVCPQDKGTGRLNDEEAFIFQWNDSVEGEDCLRVNVWTPGIGDGRRRPVMVWLHGGGFDAGSGNDLPAFDGHNLARRGDVVVVTLNHRLNLLGFLDLSAYGSRFASSGNAGMLDLVAALEWVRDNIEAFGGDPSRVTIFGQSGGGAKVSTLMGMPAARGLFHRAIVQSGSFVFSRSREMSRRLAELLIAELGIAPADIRQVEGVAYSALRKASEAVIARENRRDNRPFDIRKVGETLGYGPVIDGVDLPAAPFGPDAPAITADVPMIVGTTLNELTTGMNHPEYETMTEDDLFARVERAYPGRAQEVVKAFRERTPHAKPFDVWSRIATAPIRAAAIAQAAAKARLGASPAYLYLFSRQSPVLDGRSRAFHCAEIPYVFANPQRCASMTGGGPAAEALAAVMADAWVSFARTGDPNHSGMPQWQPAGTASQPVMVFDDATRLEHDPDKSELAALE